MPASAPRRGRSSPARCASSSWSTRWPTRSPSIVPADRASRDGRLPGGLAQDPHRRYDPLLDEWVLVSAGRTARPWLGAVEPEASHDRPTYVADCYLCPGNVRANGDRNPDYASTFVFDNDFAALRDDT